MKKLLALTALLTASAAIATSASAAPLARISLTDKSDAQIHAEVKAAARAVCKADKTSDPECVENTIRDTKLQLVRTRNSWRPAADREAGPTIRISVSGKSDQQLTAEIKLATQAVCKSSNSRLTSLEHQDCINSATSFAKTQMIALNTARAKQMAGL